MQVFCTAIEQEDTLYPKFLKSKFSALLVVVRFLITRKNKLLVPLPTKQRNLLRSVFFSKVPPELLDKLRYKLHSGLIVLTTNRINATD